MIELHVHTNMSQPLYCCFLDLKGTYDRVQRPLLWQVFRQLGVHGRILKAIQALYTGASHAISVHGRAGPSSPI